MVTSANRFSTYERFIVKRILTIIDKVCRQQTIDYFLYGETLLGYLRYLDVNPWINKVEIAIPKPKLFELAKGVIKDVSLIFILCPMLLTWQLFRPNIWPFEWFERECTEFHPTRISPWPMRSGIFHSWTFSCTRLWPMWPLRITSSVFRQLNISRRRLPFFQLVLTHSWGYR